MAPRNEYILHYIEYRGKRMEDTDFQRLNATVKLDLLAINGGDKVLAKEDYAKLRWSFFKTKISREEYLEYFKN